MNRPTTTPEFVTRRLQTIMGYARHPSFQGQEAGLVVDPVEPGSPDNRPLYETRDIANVAAAVRELRHPTQIGPYHILALIGEGGMGSVYKAEQRTPINRIVALKIVKLGMDTRQVIARFESERQALAMMDHPNVARVLDADADEAGRPYFVMEFVSGEPITAFCDRHGYTTRQRLDLFRQACAAVQHAHQKAIIHRDLKPSNILVTLQDDGPQLKVIDFGIAKAVSQRLTERTLFTETGQLVGTPEYMSPEQAGTEDVDTRTDVYSLGVVLYELLTGSLPFDPRTLRGAGYQEIQRIIRDVSPPRPSTRLSSLSDGGKEVARLRRTPLDTLSRQLRTELEWIPLKAMRKERDQRYATATELADDIDNYLLNRPLRAGPESAAYRARKFLKRNKAGVAASAAMGLLLIAGIFATTWQAVRATRAEARAAQERDSARATLDFLTNDVLSGATPDNIPDVKVRDQIVSAMINPAAARVSQTFKDRPLVEADVQTAILNVLHQIGRNDLAEPHAQAALALRRRMRGDDHQDTIQSLNNYAMVITALGRVAEAERLHHEALERSRRVLGEDHLDTLRSLHNYCYVLDVAGRSREAEPLHRQAMEGYRRVLGEDHKDSIAALNNYASVLRSLGREAEAEPLAREALDRSRRVMGEDHPDTIKSQSSYANMLWSLGRSNEAETLYSDVLERRRRVLGEDHPSTIQSLHDYATIVHSLGRTAEAEPLEREALERHERVLGNDHHRTITALNNYALMVFSLGRTTDAERLIKEALERCRRALGENHPDTIETLGNYATVLGMNGRAAEAEPLHKEAYERLRQTLGEDHAKTLGAQRNYAGVLLSLGRADEAEPLARSALAKATTNPSLGPRHARTRGIATTHARVLDALGSRAQAAAVRREYGLSDPATQAATQPANSPTTAPASPRK